MTEKCDITCIILTKNEEKNLGNCLDSLSFAKEIIVVDSGSTDSTIKIANEHNAKVISHPFESYAHQYNWVLENVEISTKWIFRIDADEIVTHKLSEEIIDNCKKHNNDDVNGFVVIFKIWFLGKLLKHAGNYPFYNLVIWKKGTAKYTERYMGEHCVLSIGKSINLKNYCIHNDTKCLDTFITKHNWYATREVIDYLDRKRENDQTNSLYKTAKKTQKLRDSFYYRMPLFFRAKMYYLYRYIIKLGFLDGKEGKIYCSIQAYWYRFIVDAKLFEYKKTGKKEDNPGDLK